MQKKYLSIPEISDLPSTVYFRYDEFGADTHAAPHQHSWGQLNYTARGVLQLEVEGQVYLSPPSYAVWVPPHHQHSCYNREAVIYRSVYIAASACEQLPLQLCAVAMSDILKAILNDFAQRDVKHPMTLADQNLAQVLLDQLQLAPIEQAYLPYGSSPQVNQILHSLRLQPANNATLADWAEQVFVSERTLARTFLRELGMSFGEWRQRLRFLAALEGLEQGQSVKALAFDLGYSSSSAFISMFQRHAGCTPEAYRRQQN